MTFDADKFDKDYPALWRFLWRIELGLENRGEQRSDRKIKMLVRLYNADLIGLTANVRGEPGSIFVTPKGKAYL